MMLKISIDALEVIDAIARKGSFAAAAESLFRVPSALTYTVRKLEADLGVTLFDRSGHRANLTEAGAELLNEGRHLLDAAQALESRVKRIATGVETDIGIAISDLFNGEPIYEILQDFYAQGFGTRVKLMREVFGGSWDALLSGRADISIGAPGEAPSGGGYSTKLLGHLDFVFAVACNHPLATFAEPLDNQDIIQHRAVAAADSSRNLPPRTSGILSGQDVLTVPDMQSKLEAQVIGLGVGYLPKKLAQRYVEQGKLIIKQVAEPKTLAPTFLAWRYHRKSSMGKAQQWLLKRFERLSLEQLLM
ncbi:MAG: LysR family transcriptional regulator [Methylotenera sp.]|nr:LysR family transcriptional regulator [Methylotenera sp.]MDO9232270.1 LysR family transcriptional regulator [Methylotenera sp.]MDO9388094.1 LysR family transcriptional regulator [Methylotenera sp.]MDP2102200.1 LysR family transcriptional regulator [Methylotenera sp.]MDP2281160.1 LysR family transcriptional regulator [Methylotenera sp.]